MAAERVVFVIASSENIRRVLYSLLAVVAVYGVVVALMFLLQRSLMYHPSANLLDPADHGVPEMQQVTLDTEDGLALTAWYRGAQEGLQTIVYFHGNGGHIGHRAGKVNAYLNAGYGLLLVCYRGYGRNPGAPTEENLATQLWLLIGAFAAHLAYIMIARPFIVPVATVFEAMTAACQLTRSKALDKSRFKTATWRPINSCSSM